MRIQIDFNNFTLNKLNVVYKASLRFSHVIFHYWAAKFTLRNYWSRFLYLRYLIDQICTVHYACKISHSLRLVLREENFQYDTEYIVKEDSCK